MRVFPTPYANVVEKLQEEGRFFELFLVVWARVEESVDALFLHDYGLRYLDIKGGLGGTEDKGAPKEQANVKFLLEHNFEKKYDYLKKRGFFEDPEKEAIGNLQGERNRLFHGNLYGSHILGLSEKEKARIAKIAVRADGAVSGAILRAFDLKFQHVHPVNTKMKPEESR